ncbi:DUF58 domain-containing protein [Anaerotignum sp. MB30-C6]|uniref:DUF58 domain-containing protein n=1 Tax=Anaerotignum sp. MB30-C6 TaxID=3070814 RepID=UPI0027DE4EA4|nr:DUF58 domain-containing protein [Anaerotignum sp. MB30-C6]WMI81511.1 DUF58 domain-containing protein [Anaerotignum sp. MB30-C6]
MRTLQDIFTKEYLMQLEKLSFSLRQRLSVDGYSGARKSHAKGSSLEFSDFREYIMGDDLRRVDWNSFGRFGKLYVKLFMEEKQAEVNIFLDCSSSMDKEEKFLQAKAFAASLAYISLCSGDRVNLFLWNDSITLEKRGNTQKSNFLGLLTLLDKAECQGGSDILRATLLSGRLGRGVAVVISDFFTEAPLEEALRVLQGKKQQVCMVQVLSAEEEKPKEGQAARLVDAETGETCDLELSPSVLSAYDQALKEHRGALGELCFRSGAAFYAMNENTPLFTAMKEVLQ